MCLLAIGVVPKVLMILGRHLVVIRVLLLPLGDAEYGLAWVIRAADGDLVLGACFLTWELVVRERGRFEERMERGGLISV